MGVIVTHVMDMGMASADNTTNANKTKTLWYYFIPMINYAKRCLPGNELQCELDYSTRRAIKD